jgi:hypothetical protein
LIISQIECKHYKLSIFNVKNNKNDEKTKLIFITDFHNKLYKTGYDSIIKDILKFNADYIILGGDLIEFSIFQSKKNIVGIKNTYKFLSQLLDEINNNKNYNLKRILFSFGNHELRLKNRLDNDGLSEEYNKFINYMKENNIFILDNNTYKISDKISISGLTLYKGYYRNIFSKKLKYKHIENDVLNEYFSDINKNDFNIIAFHKPDYAEDLIDFGYDLVLSGHYHGGLINVPYIGAVISPDFKPFPKYSNGMYEYKNAKVIVSAGLGEHFLKIRVNNIPEIVGINIY